MKKISKTYVLMVLILLLGLTNHLYHTQLVSSNKDLIKEFDIQIQDLSLTHQVQINQLKAGISQDNIRRWEILNAEKVIVKVNKKIPYTVRMNYAEWIVDETSKYDRVSTALVLGLIAQESRFRDSVTSHAGARGLGQVMPPTAGDICEHLKIPYVDGIEYNAKTNIQMTTWYLNRMILYYNSVSKALAHYNGGYRQAYRYGLIGRKDLTQEETTALSKLAEETRDYVPKVLNNFKKFKVIMTKG